jgi:predicted lipoprotein with Yx(FWY)xxD motif
VKRKKDHLCKKIQGGTLAMWSRTRTIVSAMVLSVVVLAGAADAQYNQQYPATPQPAPQPSQSIKPGTGYTVNVAMATVQGKRERVLTDARGMTLYYFTPDRPTKAACTGGCAKIWPPLLSKSKPTHATALSGKFSVVNDANGPQVSYNRHLLYRYSGDTAAGQAAGNGLYGKWFVARPGLTAAAPGGPGAAHNRKGVGW